MSSFDEMLEAPQEAVAAAPVAARPARRKDLPLIGGVPRVSLLPVEIRDAARGRTTRALLAGGVAAALLVGVGATALASVSATSAQTRLDLANAQTQTLAAKVGKFGALQKLQQDVAVSKAAAEVGASTIVDWGTQLDDIRQDMPYGYSVSSITADSASPVADYAQGTTPLEQPRAATVQMTVEAPTIIELPVWLRRLRSIPAYADATATVQQADDSGRYTVNLTVHLSPKAEVRLAGKGDAR